MSSPPLKASRFLLKRFEQRVLTPGYAAGTPVPMVDLEEVSRGLEHPFKFDIQYARADNFFKRQVYPTARAFALEHVAQDLVQVHQGLHREGYGLLIFDGYRPWSVTRLFYNECQPHEREFLANPAMGSSHNRGCAVDLTLYDLKTGKEVSMPSGFDEMNEKAWPDYMGGTSESRRLRDLLKTVMLANRFTGIKSEWWHFNHASHPQWPVMDVSFEEIALTGSALI